MQWRPETLLPAVFDEGAAAASVSLMFCLGFFGLGFRVERAAFKSSSSSKTPPAMWRHSCLIALADVP